MVSSSMRRVRLLAAASAALVVGGVALAGPSNAAPLPPRDGTGSLTCNVVGTLKFNPPLRTTSTPVATTVTLRTVLNQCTGTGDDGARVVRGVAVVSGQSDTNDCLTVLQNATAAARSGTVRWNVPPKGQKINPSTITFTSGSYNAGPPITVDASGSATGSFAGDTATSHTVLKESFAKLARSCAGMHGLKVVHFDAGSTFSLTAP